MDWPDVMLHLQRYDFHQMSTAVRTGHLAGASHTQQTRCWGREYWGRWWSRQLQGCCEDVLGKAQATHLEQLLVKAIIMVGLKTALTHNKLSDVLPLNVTSWLMNDGNSDSPLEALGLSRTARRDGNKKRCDVQYLLKHFRYYIGSQCDWQTWCSRNVPWQGIPPLWSTTAGM